MRLVFSFNHIAEYLCKCHSWEPTVKIVPDKELCWFLKLAAKFLKFARNQSWLFLVNGTYGNGIATIRSETNCTIRLFGVGLDTAGARVAFASERLEHGQRCDDQKDTDAFYLHSAVSTSALISIRLIVIESTVYYYCVKWNDSSYFFHQGTEKWLALQVNPSVSGERTTFLPIPLQVHHLPLFVANLVDIIISLLTF